MNKCAIFTPVKGHEVAVEYQAAMWQLARWPGIDYHFCQAPEDLVRTRSRGVRWFLEDTTFDDLIMWDSDIAPHPKVVVKLMQMPHPFVGARYRLKKEPVIYVPPVDPQAAPDEHGTLPVDYVPMGLVKISRTILQRMVDHYRDELEFLDVYEGKAHKTVALFSLIFDTIKEDRAIFGAPLGARVLLSEDYSFCKRARDLDIPLRLMVEPVPHVGSFVFR